MDKYNVIIPVFNESGRILKTCKAITAFLKDNPNYKFLFVDDGSKDDTVEILRRRKERYHDIDILPLGENKGKGAAVRTAIMQINKGQYVCFIDGDLAYSFNHLPILFKKLETFDVVIGSRALGFKNKKKMLLRRRILGGGFNFWVRAITGLPYKDTQAGLKGFRLDKAKKIFKKQVISRFSFDVEILFIARKYNYTVGEIPAIVARHHTEKNTRVNLIVDTIKMFFALFRIHYYNLTGQYNLKASRIKSNHAK
jgi:dolichyl-phosphate beta-glucosyltransferase